MNRLRRPLTVAFIAIVMLGGLAYLRLCDERLGGGSRSAHVPDGPKLEAVFGIRSGGGLGFVVFVDFPDAQGPITASGGSRWRGEVRDESGRGLSYAASPSRLTIDEREFDLGDGRVFLVRLGASPEQLQLDIPPGDAQHDAAIEAILRDPRFLAVVR